MLTRVILAVESVPLERRLKTVLAREDVIVDAVRGKPLLWERLARETGDYFVVSRTAIPDPMPQKIDLLRQLPDLPGVVVLTEREDVEDRAALLAAGCDAVLPVEIPNASLADVFQTLLAKRREVVEKGLTPKRDPSQPRLTNFVSKSAAMRAFMGTVQRVALSDVSLLLLGETGVGKELLARAIHADGPRSDGPFVAVNCAALPETLLESELFGHEEGAFTGATRARRGWFELAHHGVVFLDEIGEMPLHLQVKLLRVLQDHAIQRVGSERSINVDVRVMAATNRDLAAEVRAKRFREDLYYRLSVVTLTVPPLRERREDIPELVENYLSRLRVRVGREIRGITAEAMAALCRYDWPGNVRELINVVERSLILCSGNEVTLEDLPLSVGGTADASRTLFQTNVVLESDEGLPPEWLEQPWRRVRRDVVGRFEKAYLTGVLKQTGGRIGEAARRAGMEPRSLFEKMRKYGLRKEMFRGRA
jgi:DNA-binding NtrC family response regulator